MRKLAAQACRGGKQRTALGNDVVDQNDPIRKALWPLRYRERLEVLTYGRSRSHERRRRFSDRGSPIEPDPNLTPQAQLAKSHCQLPRCPQRMARGRTARHRNQQCFPHKESLKEFLARHELDHAADITRQPKGIASLHPMAKEAGGPPETPPPPG